MKKYILTPFTLLIAALLVVNCSEDFPIDEDGLLITDRGQCYVSNFDLLGTDNTSVRTPTAVAIDTTAQTIAIEVLYGTDLTNLWPQFTLVNDAKLEPKITSRMDFSDLANPRRWTVISGNRLISKEYTVTVTVRNP